MVTDEGFADEIRALAEHASLQKLRVGEVMQALMGLKADNVVSGRNAFGAVRAVKSGVE